MVQITTWIKSLFSARVVDDKISTHPKLASRSLQKSNLQLSNLNVDPLQEHAQYLDVFEIRRLGCR